MTKNTARGSASAELKLLSQLEFLPPKQAARYLELTLRVALDERAFWDLVLDQKLLISVQTTEYPIFARRGVLRRGQTDLNSVGTDT